MTYLQKLIINRWAQSTTIIANDVLPNNWACDGTCGTRGALGDWSGIVIKR
jgi:hypothetical protein